LATGPTPSWISSWAARRTASSCTDWLTVIEDDGHEK
jgi:hypothetical protein